MRLSEDTSYQSDVKARTTVRFAVADDLPFIYSTWLKSLRYGNSWYRTIDKDAYFTKYKQAITRILQASTITIVCFKDEPEVILGYSVHMDLGESTLLHWVYVKRSWRGMGFASLLVPANTSTVSHITGLGSKLMPKHWKFDPFL
jgi:predicted GNAT family acetyltransferase